MRDTTTLQQEYVDKRRVTVVGAAINFVLSIAKIVIGFVASSQGLIADGIHSLADLASDAMVLVAAKLKSKGADEQHPYGHARFETVATIGLGILLLGVAIGIAIDSVERLLEHDALATPGIIALVVAAASILSKEWLYHYTMAVARRLDSDLIRANAWHHRTDAISSIIVFIGIGGAMAGIAWLDTVAAIGVSLMIARIGWDIGWPAIMELTDTGVENEKLNEIIQTIESVEGVTEFHMLRTRKMGREVLVEVHVLVDPCVTVSEGHMIGDRVLAKLKREQPDIGDVTIHIDPEDDTDISKHIEPPDRIQVMEWLRTQWRAIPAANSIKKVNLHYLNGKIDVEVILPISAVTDLPDSKRIAHDMANALSGHEHIRNVEVMFSCNEHDKDGVTAGDKGQALRSA